MDKLSLISGAMFLAADIFAVAALAMPDWIVTDVGGETRLGLMQVPREAIIKISHQKFPRLVIYCHIIMDSQ